MKPVNIKNDTYFDCNKAVHYKDPKFKAGDRVKISKYKNIFAKEYTLIKKKGDKLYVKWKGYDSLFSS